MLEAVRVHAPVAGPIQVIWPREDVHTDAAPRQLLMMDAMTLQAITDDACRLPGGTVPAVFWVRLLRTVLDELGVGTVHAGNHHRAIRETWNSVGLGYSHYLREWRPYERLKRKYQEMFMRLAAQVFTTAFEQPAMRERIQEMAQSYSAGEPHDTSGQSAQTSLPSWS